MRMPDENEDLIGKVCVCSTGRASIITGRSEIRVKDSKAPLGSPERWFNIEGWAGLGLDGKGNWFSTSPCVIAESGHEFYETLRDRFGGKMAYNV